MTEAEVAEVARWLAVAAGYDLDRYADPVVRAQDRGWFVTFQGSSGAPGDHFAVVMTEEGREHRIVAGR